MRATDDAALCAFIITIIHIQQLYKNSLYVCHMGEFLPPEPRAAFLNPTIFHLSLINLKQADFLLINTLVYTEKCSPY